MNLLMLVLIGLMSFPAGDEDLFGDKNLPDVLNLVDVIGLPLGALPEESGVPVSSSPCSRKLVKRPFVEMLASFGGSMIPSSSLPFCVAVIFTNIVQINFLA
jgi:hypothetical protein